MEEIIKFNIIEPTPDTIKCMKCGTINVIPENIVFRIDPDGDSVFYDIFSIPKKERSEDFPISVLAYCSTCITPLYKIEGKQSDLEDIDEEKAFEIERKEIIREKIIKKGSE
ncbi:hypothetical protein LCGC14_0560130 [marine sediment metagenome]|uniref:Uncharacterized protein n=1 Tax=marine sediment metagenome TaxID=412755 RepID=A0A0F9U8Q8_9ZZZZ